MGDWQTNGTAQRFDMIGKDPLSRPIAVTASAAINVKGVWVELTPSTPIDATAITITIPEASGPADFLFDIAIGASGSETVLISNLNVSSPSTSYGDKLAVCQRIPISIKAGTRVTARAQSNVASKYLRIGIILENNNLPSGGIVVPIGVNTADSGGVLIDPGASSDVKGAWTQIVAICPSNLRALFVGFGSGANTSMSSCTWVVDIGIGAIGSEQEIIKNISLAAHNSPTTVYPAHTPCYDIQIPAGTRISARAACTIVDATDRKFDIFIYGIA